MMEGMAAVLRATQEVELSKEEIDRICYELPKVRVHECPEISHMPCGGDGMDNWELLQPSPIFSRPRRTAEDGSRIALFRRHRKCEIVSRIPLKRVSGILPPGRSCWQSSLYPKIFSVAATLF